VYILSFSLLISFTLTSCGGGSENIARGYLRALETGDCDKAASYYVPDKRANVEARCGPNAVHTLISMRIDELAGIETDVDESIWVKFLGEFEIESGYGSPWTSNEMYVRLESVEGKLYVSGNFTEQH
jgi:hypothetical protein